MEHHLYHIVAASGDAMSGQGVIGQNNALPWPKFSQDLKFFKETTMGGTVIMGRKTFESIGQKPLPERENIVVTTNYDLVLSEAVKVAHSVKEALQSASKPNVFIIGGAQLYAQTLKQIDAIFLTNVPGGPYSGDTKYPPIPSSFVRNEEKSKELKEKYKIDILYFENTERTI